MIDFARNELIQLRLLFWRWWGKKFDLSTQQGRSKDRYRKIISNSLTNLLSRGANILVGLLTVPIALSYLGAEYYGLWMIITSFVTWLVWFDFGFVNGLVNAISEANGKDDRKLAQEYISTAFFLLISISTIILIVFYILFSLIPWGTILGAKGVIPEEIVRTSVMFAVIPVIVGMPCSIVRQIYAGFQKTYIVNLFLILSSILSLIALCIAVKLKMNLPLFILVVSGTQVLVQLANLCYMVLYDMPWLTPHISAVTKTAFKRLSSTSIPLFFFQLGALSVNQTQIIIMANLCSLQTVTEYSILMRLYAAIASFIVLSTSSFFPPFRESHERCDFLWIRTGFNRLIILRLSLSGLFSCLLILYGNWLISIWLQNDNIQFGYTIFLFLAILMIVATWTTSFSDLLIIMDRIWSQVILVMLNGITVIFFSILLIPIFDITGAIIASMLFSLIIGAWVNPMLANPIFNKRTYPKIH